MLFSHQKEIIEHYFKNGPKCSTHMSLHYCTYSKGKQIIHQLSWAVRFLTLISFYYSLITICHINWAVRFLTLISLYYSSITICHIISFYSLPSTHLIHVYYHLPSLSLFSSWFGMIKNRGSGGKISPKHSCHKYHLLSTFPSSIFHPP